MFDTTPQHLDSQQSPIKVIGVGGGGSNAVNTMFNRGIAGVDFIVCNTDSQALEASPVPSKIQLGASLTSGQGAGSRPEVGRNAAIESLDDVVELLGEQTKMVFITAGMGGGTGTGAAPVIAKAAKERDILTVGIVTVPFAFEGRRRQQQAEEGLEAMREAVDTLLIIRNDKLRELYSDLTIRKAFANADEVLCTAAKGIAEVITLTGEINVDMNDVNTVMKNSGRAIMGSGKASGDGRAFKAVNEALESPLLNDKDITGANFVLLNITFGSEEILMDEITEITDFIQDAAGQEADVIWGYAMDDSLKDDLCVTVIATGFEAQNAHDEPAQPQVQWLVKGATEDTPPATHTPAPAPANPGLEKGNGLGNGFGQNAMPVQTTSMKWNATLPRDTTTPLNAPVAAPVDPKPIVPTTPVEDIPVTGSLNFTIKQAHTPEQDASETGSAENERARAEDQTSTKAQSDASNEEQVNRFSLEGEAMPDLDKPKFIVRPADSSDTPSQERPAPAAAHQKPEAVPAPTADEIVPNRAERLFRIKNFTQRIKKPGEIADLENTPAYKRRNVQLDDVPQASESNASRISFQEEVDEDGAKRVEIRTDNPFLHDNVD